MADNKQKAPQSNSSKIAWFVFLPAVILFILLITNAYWVKLYSKFMANIIYHRYGWLNALFNYFSGKGTEGGFLFFIFFLIITIIIFKVLKSAFKQQQTTIGYILIVSMVVFFILLFLVIIYYGIDSLVNPPAVSGVSDKTVSSNCRTVCLDLGYRTSSCLRGGSGTGSECLRTGGYNISKQDHIFMDCNFSAVGSWDECCCYR